MRTRSKVFGAGLLFSYACLVSGQDYLITTVAGGALPATPAPAANVSIHYPQAVAADSAGNVYVIAMNAIFKMDKSGILTRLAGASAASGNSGNGGPATSALFNSPSGIAVDSAGNVFIADTGNSVVRKVTPEGIISVAAGNGTRGLGGDGGLATNASLRAPAGLVFDSAGSLYISDWTASQIRKVTPDGIIHTLLTGRVSDPSGLAMDGSGNLYILDTMNNLVYRLAPDGTLVTVAGSGGSGSFSGDGGPATAAKLNSPYGIAIDGAGNLFIADGGNQVIREVGGDGVIHTIAGTPSSLGFSGDGGPATAAQFIVPGDVCFDSAGNLYVADAGNSRIRKISASGTITTIIGGGQLFSGDGGPATAVQLNSPLGSPVVIGGNLYVSDSQSNRIRRIAPDGTITTVAGTGTPGNTGDRGPATNAQLNLPYGLAADAAGNLYVADANNVAVRKIATDGTITSLTGGYLALGLATDSTGDIYLSCPYRNRVFRLTPGKSISAFAGQDYVAGYSGDGEPATSAMLSYPAGIATDSAGSVYIADYFNHRIRKVAGGTITTVAGNGTPGLSGEGGAATSASLRNPQGVAADAAGNLYIADSGNALVRKVTTDGVIHTIAGGGASYYSSDGGPATAAGLYADGIAVDSRGNVYLTDQFNGVVRMLTPVGRAPILMVSIGHSGVAAGGQTISSAIVVANAASAAATNGAVTVTVKPSGGLTLQGMSGSGWSCSSNTCSRSDALASGSSYPPITLAAGIDVNAPSQVTNMVLLSGGGAAYGTGAQDVISVAALATNCSYSLSPGGQFFAPAGGSGTINVTSEGGCGWSVTSDSSWVSITGSSSGSGPGSASFTVSSNAGPERAATITIGGKFFNVVQNGTRASGLNAAGSLAHVVSGGGWASTLTLVNTGAASAGAVLNFYDDNGSPLSLPFSFPQTASSVTGPSLEETLGANSVMVVKTGLGGASDGQQGWTQFLAGEDIGGFATFQYLATNYQAVVPLEARNAPSYLLGFDNTGGVATGLAIANLSTSHASVPVLVRDDAGVQLAQGNIELDAAGHTAFMLTDSIRGFSQSAGKRGTVEFDTPSGGRISVLGLRANNGKALTTLPVLADVGSGGGTLPHLAFGSGWQTILTLVNTGSTLAQVTLAYYDNAGSPLNVPMLFPQTDVTSTAASVSQTLEPHASLVIATQGSDAATATTEGWAQLQTSGNVSGFAIFQYQPSAQEAVVPLVAGSPEALILAFDNTNGESTGVALANASAARTSIPITILDDNGALIWSESITLDGHGHRSFMLADHDKGYPTTTNRRGTIRFTKPSGGQIGVLGIRAATGDVITTIPAIVK